MKAAVCREFGKPLFIEDVDLAPPGALEVRIRLKACSVCHSDISYADGIWGGQLPAVYGHEGAGIVAEVGGQVTAFSPGDHVIVTLIRHCGECRNCASEMEVICEDGLSSKPSAVISGARGEAIHQGMHCGAFAQEVVVHQSQLHKVPEDMPFDVASLLACGVITGYGAARHAAGIRKGDTVVVIGCGGVGLNAIQGAALCGAGAVVAIDIEPSKVETAMSFGATHGVNPASEDAAGRIDEITGGRGADKVLVTVGAKRAIDSAQGFAGKGGTVVVVGMPSSDTRGDYDPGTLAAWGQKLIGTKMGNTVINRDIPELLSLYEAGRYQLDRLISGQFRLEDINQALDEVRSGKAIKNVIVFDDD